MEKVLTVSIAAYNVEQYLDQTLNSLTCKNIDKLEVLIINDGSKDQTAAVAQTYVERYPQTFKVVNKENGGYGSTINKGLELATGKYFKQLDGDDKFDVDNLDRLIDELEKVDVDIVYTPFCYWRGENITPVYCGLENKQVKDDRLEEYLDGWQNDLQMHTLCYKTKLIKENGLKILENCFYTDTEYALYPFTYAKTAKFYDFPVYLYRIGEEGQSVSATGFRKHYKDNEKVIASILDNMSGYNQMPDSSVKQFLRYRVADAFYGTIVRLIKFLPYGIKSYKYIKWLDRTIKEKNPAFYVDFRKKTVYTFRKGKFLTYTALHIVLKLRYLILHK